MGQKSKVKKLKAKLKARKAELSALAARVAELEAAPVAAVAPAPEAPKAKAKHPVSPFAPAVFPALPPVPGVTLCAVEAGVRYKNRKDVMLARVEAGGAIAGVFTKSLTRSAPVLWCEERVKALREAPTKGPIAILVNSGCSNAFTGEVGRAAVKASVEGTGAMLGADPGAVFMASTGVIGEPLPYQRILDALPRLNEGLSGTPEAWEGAARAIMTTDTYPKASSAQLEIDGVPVTISGFCKGSGMIAPNMGTMLVFIFTDANMTAGALQEALDKLTGPTFNSITVDGDTSTSDTLLLASSRKARHVAIESTKDPRAAAFMLALQSVMLELAQLVVKDGEGASKFVELHITGAKSEQAARRAGLAVANSPLVKTAWAGNDPNWGRLVAAIGKSGEAADRDRLSIWFGENLVADQGLVSPAYKEAIGAEYFKRAELTIRIDLGVGKGESRVWTCDLTNRYIEINADYRS